MPSSSIVGVSHPAVQRAADFVDRRPGDNNTHMSPKPNEPNVFDEPERYDASINWDARLSREIPVLRDVFGPPGEGGILDAGCATCRQAIALAEHGYRMTAIDASDDMLAIALRRIAEAGVSATAVRLKYDELQKHFGSRFDGMYCVGNSLAAAGTRDAARTAITNFAGILRPGGRLFIQILNFPLMRRENPCVRGPRVTEQDGVTSVSSRLFTFEDDLCRVTNVTHYNDGSGWKQHSRTGMLYPLNADELTAWCREDGITVDALYGSYAREPFDEARSIDVILVGTARS